MTTQEERLKNKLEKEKQKELKAKIKEFNKVYYVYYIKKLPIKIRAEFNQKMEKLGAFKPFYADEEDKRVIFLMKMWDSEDEEIKDIVIKDAQKYFQINDRAKIVNLLNDIHQNNLEVKTRMRKMKEARKNNF